MKRIFLSLAAAALCSAAQLRAEEKQPANQNAGDSVRMYRLQEVEVTATRATPTTPVAYSDIRREEIARNSYGTDIPTLLALTPSMIATNETGIGIGGTAVRLRGTDPTRLNVTINGVAMNNPDSHSMYWYDTPDLVSAVGSIQVQRGAGISTNGTGAFGGAVNMSTDALQTEFGGDASLSYGSYNTNKQAVHISSGLMGGHWTLDARLTHIGSSTYRDALVENAFSVELIKRFRPFEEAEFFYYQDTNHIAVDLICELSGTFTPIAVSTNEDSLLKKIRDFRILRALGLKTGLPALVTLKSLAEKEEVKAINPDLILLT